MAILSDYAVGTVSIAANGVVATGTGTAWNLQAFQEGDTLMVDGYVAVIAGPPTSSTSIPLTRPWLGGAKTDVPYRIRYMSDGSRYTNRAQQLINLLGDGTLAALATVGSGINKLSYWAGAGVAALTDLSPFIRTNVLGKVDRAALLGGIDVSENVQKTGSIAADLNLITSSGWVVAYPAATANCPIPGTAAIWVVQTLMWADAPTCVQIARRLDGSGQIFGRFNSGGWTAWTVQAGNLLGTVSQSGGNPTGAIIERGSNANGEYIRFADGTMICISPTIITDVNIAAGSLFRSNAVVWTFPSTFSSVTVIGGGAINRGNVLSHRTSDEFTKDCRFWQCRTIGDNTKIIKITIDPEFVTIFDDR